MARIAQRYQRVQGGRWLQSPSPFDVRKTVKGDKNKKENVEDSSSFIPNDHVTEEPMEKMNFQNIVGRGPKPMRAKDDSGVAQAQVLLSQISPRKFRVLNSRRSAVSLKGK